MIDDKYVKTPPFIPLLQFETTTNCDGACTFCNHKTMRRHGNAKWSTMLEVIDQCVPHAAEVCPFLMGEPFKEPRLDAILDNIYQVNPWTKTVLYSNMHAPTHRQLCEIVDHQFLDRLIVSFYGPTPELYRKYQPTFDFERTANNIRYLMNYRKKQRKEKPEVIMHYIALPDLLKEYVGFDRQWSRVVDRVGATVYRPHTKEEAEYAEGFENDLWGKHASRRVPCQRLWTGFYVLFNGDVVPCSADYNGVNVLGNIHDSEPIDIWWGEKATAFREAHARGEYADMCRHCNYWKFEMNPEWNSYWTSSPKCMTQ